MSANLASEIDANQHDEKCYLTTELHLIKKYLPEGEVVTVQFFNFIVSASFRHGGDKVK